MIRAAAKKSRSLHSAYKMVRDAKSIPSRQWVHPDRIASVFRVLPDTMVTMPRLFDVIEAVETINRENIKGDLVECGVWNGGCAALMGLSDKTGRKLHLFDSFAGMPRPSPHDTNVLPYYPGPTSGELSAIGMCVGKSRVQVESFMRNLGLYNLHFHEGWFQDTVPTAKIDKIAILRLDGDWYESTRTCLEGLFSKLSPGGYLIIDDYGDFQGCRKATDEFFSEQNLFPAWQQSDACCVYYRK